ncbi:MAG: ribosome biogenesis GTP-binding protein YsxC [Chlamydiae bacterium]|nr:ribosome biogenesis GTP-binding protein YsxC [Chlamydiota bacterium]
MKKINFKNSRFVNTFVSLPLKGIHPTLPRFCFVGRSNVGKSSLINHLCDQQRLAKVSGVPGKTQAINLFAVDEQIYLFDLPGYGFSETGKNLQNSWGKLMEGFLLEYRPHVLLLTDSRHPLFASDEQMMDWLHLHDMPYTLIATKADKLNTSSKHKKTVEIQKKFAAPTLFYSVHSVEGKHSLLQNIQKICQEQSALKESPQPALA